MQLGRVTRMFTAEDTGIVAPSLRQTEVTELKTVQTPQAASRLPEAMQAKLQTAQPMTAVDTAATVKLTTKSETAAATVESSELSTEERGRLLTLIGKLREANGKLREANAKLWKANVRLTKEAGALREELDSGERLTVGSIVEAEATTVATSSARERELTR